MKTISKSNYLSFISCPKQFYYLIHKSEEYVEDPSAKQRIEDGILVGNYAKQYFNDTVDVTTVNNDGSLDIQSMIEKTKNELSLGTSTIAEASFSINGLFCSIDLLHKVDGGYEIYEVKASTSVKKEHYADAAFQQYVLKQAGLIVLGVYILHLNSSYIRHGDLDLHKLFTASRVDGNKDFLKARNTIEANLQAMEALVSSTSEPNVKLSSSCRDCPFLSYCHRSIPFPTVLDLQGSTTLNRYRLYNRGIRTFKEVIDSNQDLNNFQIRQIDCYLKNKESYINKRALKSFLSKLRYPLYHLDFESIQLPIPPCDDAWPYEQIPTQYSLHIEYEDGRLEHKEFLGSSIDPRKELAISICKDIPYGSTLLAYNKAFEAGRLIELARLFPEFRDHLLNLASNIVDLMLPFKNGDYYHKDMWNRYSIKFVLPALCPNDPELDYHSLPLVHNGIEAMSIYPKMVNAPIEEAKIIRDGLLKYCYLDTLAMVKVLEKIKEAAK